MHTSVNNAYRTMYGSIDVSTRSWLPGILASPLSSWLQQHTSKFVIRLTQDLWYIFFFNYGTSHMYSTSLIFISCQQQNQKFNLNFLLDPNCGLIKITLYNNPPPSLKQRSKAILSRYFPLLLCLRGKHLFLKLVILDIRVLVFQRFFWLICSLTTKELLGVYDL